MVWGLARRHTIGSDSVCSMMVTAGGVDFHRMATPAGLRHRQSAHLKLRYANSIPDVVARTSAGQKCCSTLNKSIYLPRKSFSICSYPIPFFFYPLLLLFISVLNAFNNINNWHWWILDLLVVKDVEAKGLFQMVQMWCFKNTASAKENDKLVFFT